MCLNKNRNYDDILAGKCACTYITSVLLLELVVLKHAGKLTILWLKRLEELTCIYIPLWQVVSWYRNLEH